MEVMFHDEAPLSYLGWEIYYTDEPLACCACKGREHRRAMNWEQLKRVLDNEDR